MYSSFMSDYIKILGSAMGFYVASLLLSALFSTLFMLAIGYDCKARNNPNRTVWMVLSFFFPLVVGIIYACTRNNNARPQLKACVTCGARLDASMTFCPNCGNNVFNQSENTIDDALVKKSKTFFGFSVAVYVISIFVSMVMMLNLVSTVFNSFDDLTDDFNFSYDWELGDDNDEEYELHYGYTLKGERVYYDREGNIYYDDDDVIYYDYQGNKYVYDHDDYVFENIATRERLDDLYCYVDFAGYLIFDEAGALLDENAIIRYDEESDCLTDDEHNVYFYADQVSWDCDGNMVDIYGNLLIMG